MTNPYARKGPESFWKQAVATPLFREVAPIPAKRFRLVPQDAIATAGSCFAQNVATFLKKRGGVRLLEVETIAPDQPAFSARYGNIYTARQLVQLVLESLGERRPADIVWRRPDGRFVDALRPTIFTAGFADAAQALVERRKHLEAVRSLLSKCTVFVFTLGLTEAWCSTRDGTVYPLAPGVAADPERPQDFEFRNFTYEEVRDDIRRFVGLVKEANPSARVLLTVSPVPLTATYTDEHVLVATTHSKSILRAVASAAEAEHDNVYYFPAYEIVTGNFSRGRYFEDNLRSITAEGVAHVMRVFEETYELGPGEREGAAATAALFSGADETTICDEEEIVKTLGF